MALLPKLKTTAQLIYDLHESRTEPARGYLGWSQLGKKCSRELWYSFRWAKKSKFDGRMLRLFDTGHREEARVIEELKAAGLEVYDKDPETGKQWAVSSFGGHLKGHADLVVKGLPEDPQNYNLVDVKTVKSDKFKQLLKDGIKAMYPQYYIQGQGYMGLLELEKAQFIFVNKDTDEIHSERFHFSERDFQDAMDKAKNIIEAETPPSKLSDDPAYWECKFCNFWDICHTAKLPDVNCRTCAHSTPVLEGAWTCANNGPIEKATEVHACHVYHPVFFIPRQVLDFVDETIIYDDGIKNGVAGMNSESLKELINNDAQSIALDGFFNGLEATVQKAWKK